MKPVRTSLYELMQTANDIFDDAQPLAGPIGRGVDDAQQRG